MAEIYSPETYSAPLVYLFSGSGVPLYDRAGKPIGNEIIDFQYFYHAAEDDQCVIIIQSADRRLADNPLLREDSALLVRWGYRTNDGRRILSDTRKIAIRDTETMYNSAGVRMKLKCTDQVSYLKEIQENAIRRDNFIDWLSEIVRDEYRVAIRLSDRNLVTENQKRPAKIIQENQGINGNVRVALDKTAAPLLLDFTKELVIKGQSKSIKAAIEDELKFVKGGPYDVDGRDDKLTIHNIDFNQEPSFYMGFSDGSIKIIDFIASTDLKDNSVKDTETPGLTSDKTVSNTKANNVANDDLMEEIDVPGGTITGNDLNRYLNTMLEEMETRMKTGNVKDLDVDEFNKQMRLAPGLKTYKDTHGYFNGAQEARIRSDRGFTTAIDNTAAPFFLPGEPIRLNIPAKIILALDETEERLTAMVENDVLRRHYKKYKATLKCIGHPRIECRQTIRVSQVASRHAGVYYVEQCNHHLSKDGGFVCNLTLIQEPQPLTIIKGKVNQALEAFKKAVAEDDGSAPVLLEDSQLLEITTEKVITKIKGEEIGQVNSDELLETLKEFNMVSKEETDVTKDILTVDPSSDNPEASSAKPVTGKGQLPASPTNTDY